MTRVDDSFKDSIPIASPQEAAEMRAKELKRLSDGKAHNAATKAANEALQAFKLKERQREREQEAAIEAYAAKKAAQQVRARAHVCACACMCVRVRSCACVRARARAALVGCTVLAAGSTAVAVVFWRRCNNASRRSRPPACPARTQPHSHAHGAVWPRRRSARAWRRRAVQQRRPSASASPTPCSRTT